MGDFKRSSSRFSKGGGNEGSSRGGDNGGGERQEGRSGGNSRGGGGYSRGGRSGGNGGGGYRGGRQQEGEFPFTFIGNISMPKSASDDACKFVDSELKGSNLTMNAKIYLGKDENSELVLKNGDMLLIQFKNGERDKDFVIGKVSVKN